MSYFPDTSTFFNSFFLYTFPIISWLLAFFALKKDASKERGKYAQIYLLIFASPSIQMYPRYDHKHILFAFPLAAFALAYARDVLQQRHIKKLIAVFFWGSILTGIYKTAQLIPSITNPTGSYLGIQAAGNIGYLLKEVDQVVKYMKGPLAIKQNDAVLVFPHDTIFYYNNFKNPTAHLHFLPGFTEFYGESQTEVLKKFEQAGGKYIILGLEEFFQKQTPILAKEFYKNYRILKKFPIRYSIWVKN